MKHHILKFFKLLIPILAIQYLILQTSKVEGVSMQGTFYENDIIFVSMLSYGLPVPSFNKYTIKDVFDDDHIITGEGPDRGDIITLKHNKKDEVQHYIKRMIAKDGDELIFTNNKMYLHTKEDMNSPRRRLNGKDWYANPYEKQYRSSNTFFTEYKRNRDELIYGYYNGALKPIYLENLGDKDTFKIKGEKYNAFYFKVPAGEYFVMGDNVDMSSDSRLFGSIKYKDIMGKVVATFRL